MATNAKGSVTSLSSLYRAEEARKAALMVVQRIAENQNELQTLNLFLSENANLIKLVHKLPDELSHNVMVPFGKAAFFPGRLIHTNEFLVLLGEGYYVERTSKQTVEILGRRGKGLESQIESLKAMMEDLKAEASFFLSTADEAAEGVVEIREDYIEEITSERFSDQAAVSKVDVVSTSKDAGIRGDDEDEEYARIMAKLDELEREELAAESVEGDEGQYFDQSLKTQETNHATPLDLKFHVGCHKATHESVHESIRASYTVRPIPVRNLPVGNREEHTSSVRYRPGNVRGSSLFPVSIAKDVSRNNLFKK
ncbi:hypothetical protein Syun_027507 [Stephania yunnanensis]|uniref:RNA polymerase II subunit 5-mediating protein homolog n=1 Tax=Stephania yunnanensis TaxID=152371 RepID=A0AAP0HQA0_9MAGN